MRTRRREASSSKGGRARLPIPDVEVINEPIGKQEGSKARRDADRGSRTGRRKRCRGRRRGRLESSWKRRGDVDESKHKHAPTVIGTSSSESKGHGENASQWIPNPCWGSGPSGPTIGLRDPPGLNTSAPEIETPTMEPVHASQLSSDEGVRKRAKRCCPPAPGVAGREWGDAGLDGDRTRSPWSGPQKATAWRLGIAIRQPLRRLWRPWASDAVFGRDLRLKPSSQTRPRQHRCSRWPGGPDLHRRRPAGYRPGDEPPWNRSSRPCPRSQRPRRRPSGAGPRCDEQPRPAADATQLRQLALTLPQRSLAGLVINAIWVVDWVDTVAVLWGCSFLVIEGAPCMARAEALSDVEGVGRHESLHHPAIRRELWSALKPTSGAVRQ